ncbi:MAG: hypothetical protein JWP97_411 [Labilithrix sp.]|nr:hypothetical protein [Labilithrix sp.]
MHATLRRATGLPSLRSSRIVESFLRCATTYGDEDEFRVLHLATTLEHLHVIVEAASSQTLQRGLQSLAIRTARNVNMLLERTGALWDDRFAQEVIPSAEAMTKLLERHFGREQSAAIASPQTAIAQEGWTAFLAHVGGRAT